MKKLFFVIGASGSGKTTVVEALQGKKPDLHIAFFDSIGVPSIEEMEQTYGSGEGWQKAKTIQWVTTLKQTVLQERGALLDGQTRPQFIEEACQQNDITNYAIILLDCTDVERKRRLAARGQPELCTAEMLNWAAYLRREASSRGSVILDNTTLTKDEMASLLLQLVEENG